MYGECQIEHGRARRQAYQVAFGGEYVYLRREEIELDCIEEVDCIGFGISQNILDGVHPFVEFRVIVMHTGLVFPMGGISQLGHFIHLSRAYLHLDPAPFGAHGSQMQSPVTVCFRGAGPVAQTVGMHFVSVSEECVYLPAADFLERIVIVLEYHAHGVDIVYFFKRHLLCLHLVVDAVGALHPGLHLVFETGRVELLAHRPHEFLHYLLAVALALLHLGHYLGILGRVFIFEREVFEFLFDLEETEPVGERRVDVERLAGNLILLLRTHRAEGAHIVEPVGHFYKHYAYVGRHR